MSQDDQSRSLADEAANWVPPWARVQPPAPAAAEPAEESAEEPAAAGDTAVHDSAALDAEPAADAALIVDAEPDLEAVLVVADEPAPAPEAEPELAPEPDAELDAEPEAAEAGAPLDAELDAEPDPDPDPELAAEPDPELDAEPEPELAAEPEPDLELDAEPDPELDAEPEPDAEPDAEPELAAEPEPELAPELAAEPEPEPELAAEPEPDAEPELAAELEAVEPEAVEPVAEADAELDAEPEADPAAEVDAESDAEPEAESAAEPDVEAAAEPEVEAAAGREPTGGDVLFDLVAAAPPASGTVVEQPAPEMSETELRGAVEAILLIVDEPATEVTLAQVLDQPVDRIRWVLEDIARHYTSLGLGFDLRQVAGGWRLYTRAEFAPYVEKFVLDGQQIRLTQAALETLAVVAYKQPVTRSRISAIRGVNCDGVVRTLVTRGLIEETGSEPESGAFLYRTTSLFLEKLGLNSVDQLPPLAPFLPDDIDEIADAQR